MLKFIILLVVGSGPLWCLPIPFWNSLTVEWSVFSPTIGNPLWSLFSQLCCPEALIHLFSVHLSPLFSGQVCLASLGLQVKLLGSAMGSVSWYSSVPRVWVDLGVWRWIQLFSQNSEDAQSLEPIFPLEQCCKSGIGSFTTLNTDPGAHAQPGLGGMGMPGQLWLLRTAFPASSRRA